ncbi:glutathione ABC transporter substrate-binding protein [Bacillus daqingensis]|uniref:Glutathione ABC transporter substrate-binding protein n=1 Tax=Bacillus daqingensis TaxID=872396 RepID=A0ABV9NZ80_9BACI
MKKYAGLLVGTLILAGCAGEPENTNDPAENTDAENNVEAAEGNEEGDGERVEEDYLQIGVQTDPVALDPHGANENVANAINSSVYDRLVYVDEDLEIVPGLAEEFEQLDEMTWEFNIREGITFHDGEELNAEVVQMNFERILDEDIGSPVAFIFDMIEEVEVIDDYTVQMTTDVPFAPLPSHLAHPGGGIVSPALIEASYEEMEEGGSPFNAANTQAAGTGYFQLEDYNSGEYVTFSRNEDYWNGEANVEGVTFRIIPEPLTRIGELETGGIDISVPVVPSDIGRVEQADGVNLNEQPSSMLAYLGFNTDVEPFNDPEVRRAIHMALNKDDIIEGVLNGTGIKADGPIAPEVFGASENLDALEYDPEEAEQMLRDAGVEEGFEVSLLTSESQDSIDAAELIQAQLSVLGIDVSIESYEIGTYLEMAGDGDTEMFYGTWGTVTMDADYGLYGPFHSSNAGPPGNRSFIENDELDSLLEAGREAQTEEERLEIYEEAQNLLIEESPYAFLYYPSSISAVTDDVEGFWQYPSGYYYLKDVELNR